MLFNIGALYTQIGARQDRATEEGLDEAVDKFLRAAGTFEFIKENFNHAPSSDLEPDCLKMLVQLMLSQARECLFEKMVLSLGDGDDLDSCLDLSQEAAHISTSYEEVLRAMVETRVKQCVPYYWLCLVQIKREHYRALADYYVALGLVTQQEDLSDRSVKTLQHLHDLQQLGESERPAVPRTAEQRKYLGDCLQDKDIFITFIFTGKAHLRESLLMHEEALRLNRMCPELRNKDILKSVLKHFHERSLTIYQDIDDEDDFQVNYFQNLRSYLVFQELMEPPSIVPSTSFQLSLSYPDFCSQPVTDLCRLLGPESVFSAKHSWTQPRTSQLAKKDAKGYGLALQGSSPVVVTRVEQDSAAQVRRSFSLRQMAFGI